MMLVVCIILNMHGGNLRAYKWSVMVIPYQQIPSCLSEVSPSGLNVNSIRFEQRSLATPLDIYVPWAFMNKFKSFTAVSEFSPWKRIIGPTATAFFSMPPTRRANSRSGSAGFPLWASTVPIQSRYEILRATFGFTNDHFRHINQFGHSFKAKFHPNRQDE